MDAQEQIEKILADSEERESVDLIASGYEWTCPKCGKLNREIEWTATVTCRATQKEQRERGVPKSIGCGATFETNPPEHAYE